MNCAHPGGWSRQGRRNGKRKRSAQRQDEFATFDRNAGTRIAVHANHLLDAVELIGDVVA